MSENFKNENPNESLLNSSKVSNSILEYARDFKLKVTKEFNSIKNEILLQNVAGEQLIGNLNVAFQAFWNKFKELEVWSQSLVNDMNTAFTDFGANIETFVTTKIDERFADLELRTSKFVRDEIAKVLPQSIPLNIKELAAKAVAEATTLNTNKAKSSAKLFYEELFGPESNDKGIPNMVGDRYFFKDNNMPVRYMLVVEAGRLNFKRVLPETVLRGEHLQLFTVMFNKIKAGENEWAYEAINLAPEIKFENWFSKMLKKLKQTYIPKKANNGANENFYYTLKYNHCQVQFTKHINKGYDRFNSKFFYTGGEDTYFLFISNYNQGNNKNAGNKNKNNNNNQQTNRPNQQDKRLNNKNNSMNQQQMMAKVLTEIENLKKVNTQNRTGNQRNNFKRNKNRFQGQVKRNNNRRYRPNNNNYRGPPRNGNQFQGRNWNRQGWNQSWGPPPFSSYNPYWGF